MPTRVASAEDHSDHESSQSASPTASPAAGAQRNLVVRGAQVPRKVSGSKRKRADTTTAQSSNQRRRSNRSDDEPSDVESVSDAGSQQGPAEDVYDPDQPAEERRNVRRDIRSLMQDVTENSEEYIQSDSRGLNETILKANEYLKKVKRPGEAASDSRLLVTTTDLSYRKTLRLTQGSLSQGVDVDEFVSKCITYMRQGRGIEDDNAPELSSTQRHRRRSRARDTAEDDGDVGDEGDMMNWAHLGRYAALPHIRRPALPGFLLGPLSVEKKVRKITKRSAPFRPNNLEETRPEVLDGNDFAKKENDLTAICGKILQQLQSVQERVQQTVVEIIEANDDMSDAEQAEVMHQHGLRSTGGIDLMRFVVNPKSFGQTIENMFYVSFLIRDGRVQIEYDENELPALGKTGLPAPHREKRLSTWLTRNFSTGRTRGRRRWSRSAKYFQTPGYPIDGYGDLAGHRGHA